MNTALSSEVGFSKGIERYFKRDHEKVAMRNHTQKNHRGRIELRRKFWNFTHPEEERRIVPPLVIYADLIAAGDPRTNATAELIYDKYFDGYYGKTGR